MLRSLKLASIALLAMGAAWSVAAPAKATETNNSIVEVAGGETFTTALHADGTVWAWGLKEYGQLGIPDTGTTPYDNRVPHQVPGLPGIKQIAAGESFTLALDTQGKVWFWGAMDPATTGTLVSATPMVFDTLPPIASITAGSTFGVFVEDAGTSGGRVYTVGTSASFALGQKDVLASAAPAEVMLSAGTPLTGILKAAAGDDYVLAQTVDGRVWAWGDNTDGQVGNDTAADTKFPALLDGLTNVQEIAAGKGLNTSFAITSAGVYGWGYNETSELGFYKNENGDHVGDDILTPTLIDSLAGKTVKTIVATPESAAPTIALLQDGTLLEAGNHALFRSSNYSDESGITELFAAPNRKYALKSDGMYGWGSNSDDSSSYYGLVIPKMFVDDYYYPPAKLPQLQAAYDTSMKKPLHARASIYNHTSFSISVTQPDYTYVDSVLVEVWPLGSNDPNAVVVKSSVDYYHRSGEQSVDFYETLQPGTYEIRLYNRDTKGTVPVLSEPYILNNGGKGYSIYAPVSSISIPVQKLVNDAWVPAAGTTVSLSSALLDETRYATADSNGVAMFSDLYPGHYDIGIYEQGYSEITKSITLLDGSLMMKNQKLAPAEQPHEIDFLDDTDLRSGYLQGTLSWMPPEMGDDAYSQYLFYWEDSAGNLVKAADGSDLPPVASAATCSAGEGGLCFFMDAEIPLGTEIPQGAAALRMYMDAVKTARTVPVFDEPVSVPGKFTFTDTNPAAGDITGTFQWSKPENEAGIANYVLLTAGYGDGLIVHRTPANGSAEYRIDLFGMTTNYPMNEYVLGIENAQGDIYNTHSYVQSVDIRTAGPLPTITTDNSLPIPDIINWTNTDPDEGEFGGQLQWTLSSSATEEPTGFDVLLLDEAGQPVSYIASMTLPVFVPLFAAVSIDSFDYGAPVYSLQIPDNTLLQAGQKLAVYSRNADGQYSLPATKQVATPSAPNFTEVSVNGNDLTLDPHTIQEFDVAPDQQLLPISVQLNRMDAQWKINGATVTGAVYDAPLQYGQTDFQIEAFVDGEAEVSTYKFRVNRLTRPGFSSLDLTVTNITYNHATLSWTSALDSYGIAGYLLSINGQTPVPIEPYASGNTLTYDLIGLIPGQSYKVAVSAVSTKGQYSLVGPSNSFNTPADSTGGGPISTAPVFGSKLLTVSGITTSGATLTWEGANDPDGISGYWLSLNGGQLLPIEPTVTGAAYTYTVTGLQPNQSYKAMIYATDVYGYVSTDNPTEQFSTLRPEYLFNDINPQAGQIGGTIRWTVVQPEGGTFAVFKGDPNTSGSVLLKQVNITAGTKSGKITLDNGTTYAPTETLVVARLTNGKWAVEFTPQFVDAASKEQVLSTYKAAIERNGEVNMAYFLEFALFNPMFAGEPLTVEEMEMYLQTITPVTFTAP